MSNFSSFKLNSEILSALKSKGYEKPTPIQAKAIPILLEGRDLLGIAQTGTGKTAAFLLPIINQIINDKYKVKSKCCRTLILTPTRELATQIEQSLKDYALGMGITSVTVFGGVSSRPQMKKIGHGVEFIVATPGRLLDLMNQKAVFYDELEFFVLDEADRMLDMGFIHDIKKIIKKIPAKRQTLLFSATMPSDIAKLAKSLLKNPETVEVTPQATTVEKIDQKIYPVIKKNKTRLLESIIQRDSVKSALVFTRTKHGANKVVKYLLGVGISSAAIHGNKSQGAREKALADFKAGRINVLIATDIAARGIDVNELSHVINFDLPNDPESYVHRIGRTARAGKEGMAISFCDKEEEKLLKIIERLIKYKIPIDKTHAFYGVAAPIGESVPGAPHRKSTRNTKNPFKKRRPGSKVTTKKKRSNPSGHKNRVKKAD